MQNIVVITGVVRDLSPGFTTKNVRCCSAKLLVVDKFILTVKAYGSVAEILSTARIGQQLTVSGPLIPCEIDPSTKEPKKSRVFIRCDAVAFLPSGTPCSEAVAAHLGSEVNRE